MSCVCEEQRVDECVVVCYVSGCKDLPNMQFTVLRACESFNGDVRAVQYFFLFDIGVVSNSF